MSDLSNDTQKSSNQSFVPRPTDWGRMQAQHNDGQVVLTGEDGRTVSIDKTDTRRIAVRYTVPGTPPFVTQGNLSNSDVRRRWARDIAGAAPDIREGVAADLNQAALEWEEDPVSPSLSQRPTKADLSKAAFHVLSVKGDLFRASDGATYWLERDIGKLERLTSIRVRDQLFLNLELAPTDKLTTDVVSGLESIVRDRAEETEVHKLSVVLHDTLYVDAGDGHLLRIHAGTKKPKRVPNGTDGVLMVADGKCVPIDPAPNSPPGATEKLFSKVIRTADGKGLTAIQQRRLLKCYLVATLLLPRHVTHPVVAFIGPAGAGKTLGGAQTILQLLTGQRTEERLYSIGDKIRDVETLLRRRTVACIDNVDGHVPDPWLNLIAASASRASAVHRQLYTDDTLHEGMLDCHLILTSRDPHFGREDVAQRVLPIFLRRWGFRREEKRLEDDQLANVVAEARPAVWAELLGLAGQVLALRKSPFAVGTSIRLADFARVVHATAEIEGWRDDAEPLLQGLQTEQLRLYAKREPVVEALLTYAQSERAALDDMRAGEMLDMLKEVSPRADSLTPERLAKALKAHQDALSWAGIEVSWRYDPHIQAFRYSAQFSRLQAVGDCIGSEGSE